LEGSKGSPKNTKSILYSAWTPKNNWNGKRADIKETIFYSIQNQMGVQPVDSIRLPLETFVAGLKPVPSPYLVKGQLSESAQRGRGIFFDKMKVDCSKCHPGKVFTNLQTATSICNDIWDDSKIKVPSLNECWRTAPWDHIGSSISMDSVCINNAHSSSANSLSSQEFKDLVEYVLSL
jgi:cytochrome c peroxidase